MNNNKHHLDDLLGLPLEIGDTVLCISGTSRTIEKIKEINYESILTETDQVYFLPNVLRINNIIKDIRYFRGSRCKSDIIDFMGNIIKVGSRVLALNGVHHEVTTISEIRDGSIMCEDGKVYLAYNIICIESIIRKSPEYFI